MDLLYCAFWSLCTLGLEGSTYTCSSSGCEDGYRLQSESVPERHLLLSPVLVALKIVLRS